MPIMILLIAIPLFTVIKCSIFKGYNNILWGLSLIAYLIICNIINKTNQDFMIAFTEGLGTIIYGIGFLLQILIKNKSKEDSQ